jgi:hypothetical protein
MQILLILGALVSVISMVVTFAFILPKVKEDHTIPRRHWLDFKRRQGIIHPLVSILGGGLLIVCSGLVPFSLFIIMATLSNLLTHLNEGIVVLILSWTSNIVFLTFLLDFYKFIQGGRGNHGGSSIF